MSTCHYIAPNQCATSPTGQLWFSRLCQTIDSCELWLPWKRIPGYVVNILLNTLATTLNSSISSRWAKQVILKSTALPAMWVIYQTLVDTRDRILPILLYREYGVNFIVWGEIKSNLLLEVNKESVHLQLTRTWVHFKGDTKKNEMLQIKGHWNLESALVQKFGVVMLVKLFWSYLFKSISPN